MRETATLPDGWRTVRFDQMAQSITERVDDPSLANVDYYVGLEHLDPESLKIRRWGVPTDVAATKLRFQPGDIIFGRRRAYQRKLAVAEFEGICSAHALVLRARPETALPEFLPFFMQSDLFFERALEISVGSLSPTINWKTLARQEFALPPIEEQRRIAELLWAADEATEYWQTAKSYLADAATRIAHDFFKSGGKQDHAVLSDLCLKIGSGKTPRGGESAYSDSGVLFLRSQNIYNDGLRVDDAVYIPSKVDNGMASTRVQFYDVLLNITGASIGRCTIYDRAESANVNQHVCILRPDASRILPHFLMYYLQSEYGQNQIRKFTTKGNREGLNFQQLGSFSIPTPPLPEQETLVSLLSVLISTEHVSNINSANLDLTKQRVSNLLLHPAGDYK